MSKNALLNRLEQDIVKAFQATDPPSTEDTPNAQQALEHEKANRQSRSRPLDVLEYQPCEHDSALSLIKSWHLLFFARTGTTHIQGLCRALQQETGRDVQLMKRFKSVQAQYRQHAARESQTVSESVASQPVIAEICYGCLSIVPGFWLPEEMEMGVSLIPTTGAKLPLDALTLVEHCRPGTSQSLDVLLVTAPSPRTKAELATLRYTPGDGLDLERHTITLCTPVGIIFTLGAVDLFDATLLAVTAAIIGGKTPEDPSQGKTMHLRTEQLQRLGSTPSVSDLIEVRQGLLAGDEAR